MTSRHNTAQLLRFSGSILGSWGSIISHQVIVQENLQYLAEQRNAEAHLADASDCCTNDDEENTAVSDEHSKVVESVLREAMSRR